MRQFSLSLIFALLAFGAISQSEQLEQAALHRPFQRLYLHTDHSTYGLGEMIWVRAYLTDDELKPCNQPSQYIQVQLFDPKGKQVGYTTLFCLKGQLADGIHIPAGEAGGVYTLRAFTPEQEELGEETCFEKEIVVQKFVRPRLRLKLELERTQYLPGERVLAKLDAQTSDNQPVAKQFCKMKLSLDGKPVREALVLTNEEGIANFAVELPDELPNSDGLLQVSVTHDGITESVAKAVPLAEREVRLRFFPEGGDLSLAWENRVAFEATDSLGNPVDCRGWVFNSKGEKVTELVSFHRGMGSFQLAPEMGLNYYVRLQGKVQTYPLPTAFMEKYGLQILPQAEGAAHVEAKVFSLDKWPCQLVLRHGDKVVWQKEIQWQDVATPVQVPVGNLPAGIAQLTVLDMVGKPHAERLFFVNDHRQLQIDISTKKEKYLPGEQVEAEISVTDSYGKPVSGDFSVAVVEDAAWAQADDRQDNILSRLLLTSELKGHIDDPSFYFYKTQPKRREALDLLMLTHGWRRFPWKDVLRKTADEWAAMPRPQVTPALVIGYVYLRNNFRKTGMRVWVNGTDREAKTDKNGRFELDVSGLDFPLTLRVKHRGREASMVITLPSTQRPPVPKIGKLGELKTAVHDIKEIAAAGAEVKVKEELSIGNLPTRNVDGLAVSSSLEEVVVTGYGVSAARNSLGYAAVQVHEMAPRQWDVSPGFGDNIFLGSEMEEEGFGFYIHQEQRYAYQYARRQFYQPYRYRKTARNDKRKTVFWQPYLRVEEGQGSLKFFASGEVSTFRIVMEGLGEGSEGWQAGRAEATYFAERPLSLEVRLPKAVTFGDTMQAEVLLANRTDGPLGGTFTSKVLYGGFELLDSSAFGKTLNLPAGEVTRLGVALRAEEVEGVKSLRFTFDGQIPAFATEQVEVLAKGFPKELYASGKDEGRLLTFDVQEPVQGSLKASFSAYPHLLGTITEGLESIVREPYGCFEQVTSSNYPNVLALQVLQHGNLLDLDFQRKAKKFLKTGYAKLSGYEAPGGGFSLYGRGTGSVRLTAYGLLQLTDMQEVYDGVNQRQLDRALEWLLTQRNVNGVFPGGQLTHVFTLYVLSELGALPSANDLAGLDEMARETNEPYLLSLIACANLNAQRPDTDWQVERLLKLLGRQRPGNFKVTQTFALSYGRAFQVETAAWSAFALLKAGKHEHPHFQKLIDFLHQSRDGRGGYGGTQATVMALKVLKNLAEISTETTGSGEIIVEVNGHTETLNYDETTFRRLHFDLSPHFRTGANQVSIRQAGTGGPVPYTVEANWRTLEVPAANGYPLAVDTRLSANEVTASDFVRLDVSIRNKTDEEVNAPLAIVGIPAGLSLQGWQLTDLHEKSVFDHFEIQANRLVIYYERMGPGDEKNFHLDLKADVPGRYESPASVVYPYYSAEQKFWTGGEEVLVR